MKKALALLLCLMMLLALPVGCKKDKEAKKVGELTDAQISSDLINSDHLYHFAYTGNISSLAGLKVSDKKQDGNTITLKATGTASSAYVQVALAAEMKYTVINNAWKLDSVQITKAVPTLIDGPEQEAILMTVENYIDNNMTSQEQKKSVALAYLGEERHSLEVNPRAVTWGVEYKKGSNTAKLTAKLTSATLTFSGYYTLTWDEKSGWIIESEKQDNGQHYLVLHLDTLEQKAAEEK